jgi:hypothetical protein
MAMFTAVNKLSAVVVPSERPAELNDVPQTDQNAPSQPTDETTAMTSDVHGSVHDEDAVRDTVEEEFEAIETIESDEEGEQHAEEEEEDTPRARQTSRQSEETPAPTERRTLLQPYPTCQRGEYMAYDVRGDWVSVLVCLRSGTDCTLQLETAGYHLSEKCYEMMEHGNEKGLKGDLVELSKGKTITQREMSKTRKLEAILIQSRYVCTL